MKKINALELRDILMEYDSEELSRMKVVIEMGRERRNLLSEAEYVNKIEEYECHFRLIHVK
ncbi:MAG: hypothetical protein ACRC28_18530 [Clostridium sp.]|uniref:hypothetical protein n=1 Tax=Clostridium sp. TaxID=1506 RepID=UPI003F3FE149